MSVNALPPVNLCSHCRGDGKCPDCTGTGINTHLNEAEPKCQACSGSGVCPDCRGTGKAYVRPAEILVIGLNKL